MLAKAIVELEAQYPSQVDPRVLAWLNLAGVAGMIYGTRFFAYRMRRENEREEKRDRPAPSAPMQVDAPGIATFPDNFHTSRN